MSAGYDLTRPAQLECRHQERARADAAVARSVALIKRIAQRMGVRLPEARA